LTTTLGLALWLGFYGSPTKIALPPADVAIVSLQNEIAAETDSTETDSDGGTETPGGEEDGDNSSEEESD
jgi:hypothetical protein